MIERIEITIEPITADNQPTINIAGHEYRVITSSAIESFYLVAEPQPGTREWYEAKAIMTEQRERIREILRKRE